MGRNAIGDPRESPDAAGENDHGVGRIRAAGDVGANIGVGLRLDLSGLLAEQLFDEVVAAAKFEFLGHDAKGAVGRNEVNGLDTVVQFDCAQEMAKEDCSAASGRGDGQILRRG